MDRERTATSVEQRAFNPCVRGSTPSRSSNLLPLRLVGRAAAFDSASRTQFCVARFEP
mgnify:CR=1 FL=1